MQLFITAETFEGKTFGCTIISDISLLSKHDDNLFDFCLKETKPFFNV
jgi:hypothetical protein